MIVLVTGATGYVGRHVAAQCLARGWQVHLLCRPDSVVPPMLTGGIVRHDIDGTLAGLTEVLTAVLPDCVLHLASAPAGAHNTENVDRLIQANIRFPVLLLEAMRISGVRRLVNTGTFWQHYNESRYWPTDFYAATKQAFEDLLRHYTDRHQLSAVTLKLYDTYGPDDPRRRIVTGLVEAAKTGTRLEMSAGEQVLDLTHVEDVGTAFALAAQYVCTLPEGAQETFFVSGERMPLHALVAMVATKSTNGLDARLGVRSYREREVMNPIVPGDRRLPGWAAVHTVSATIDAMLAA